MIQHGVCNSGNNKIENIFQKVFPKQIKRTTELGLLSRMPKIKSLEHEKLKIKNHRSF